jgi:hypothetical protein
MTFCLHVQIRPFTAVEDTYALLFMHIESEYNLVFGTA